MALDSFAERPPPPLRRAAPLLVGPPSANTRLTNEDIYFREHAYGVNSYTNANPNLIEVGVRASRGILRPLAHICFLVGALRLSVGFLALVHVEVFRRSYVNLPQRTLHIWPLGAMPDVRISTLMLPHL